MAIKHWSFGKLVGVVFGGFFGFIAISLFAIKLISGGNGTPDTLKPRKSPEVNSSVLTANPSQTRAVAAPGAQVAPADIVSVQLEGTQRALREAQESARALEQKLAQALSERDGALVKQFQSLRDDMQALNKRLFALERSQMLSTDVQIIRPSSATPDASDQGQPAAANDLYTPPKGFVVRATMGDRVWLSDGTREISVLKGQEPPKATTHAKAPPPSRRQPIVSSAQR